MSGPNIRVFSGVALKEREPDPNTRGWAVVIIDSFPSRIYFVSETQGRDKSVSSTGDLVLFLEDAMEYTFTCL